MGLALWETGLDVSRDQPDASLRHRRFDAASVEARGHGGLPEGHVEARGSATRPRQLHNSVVRSLLASVKAFAPSK